MLTVEYLRKMLDYDKTTGIFRWKVTLGTRAYIEVGKIAGSVHSEDAHWRIPLCGERYPASRLAWLYVYGKWPGGYLAYKDGDRHNNAISNLHEAMKTVALTVQRLREVLDYDPVTGAFRWRIDGSRAGNLGGGRDGLYWQVHVDNKRYYGHRLAWFYVYGKWPSRGLDHKDRNKQNNAISNLREATAPQNGANAGVDRRNELGIKCVRAHKNSQGFSVRVAGDYIGSFRTVEEAQDAYFSEAKRRYGEFARRK